MQWVAFSTIDIAGGSNDLTKFAGSIPLRGGSGKRPARSGRGLPADAYSASGGPRSYLRLSHHGTAFLAASTSSMD